MSFRLLRGAVRGQDSALLGATRETEASPCRPWLCAVPKRSAPPCPAPGSRGRGGGCEAAAGPLEPAGVPGPGGEPGSATPGPSLWAASCLSGGLSFSICKVDLGRGFSTMLPPREHLATAGDACGHHHQESSWHGVGGEPGMQLTAPPRAGKPPAGDDQAQVSICQSREPASSEPNW